MSRGAECLEAARALMLLIDVMLVSPRIRGAGPAHCMFASSGRSTSSTRGQFSAFDINVYVVPNSHLVLLLGAVRRLRRGLLRHDWLETNLPDTLAKPCNRESFSADPGLSDPTPLHVNMRAPTRAIAIAIAHRPGNCLGHVLPT